MKNIILTMLLMFTFNSMAVENYASNGFQLTKASTINASLFSQEKVNQLRAPGSCTWTCNNEYHACLAQPDPWGLNIDICRRDLEFCLVARCGWSGGIPR